MSGYVEPKTEPDYIYIGSRNDDKLRTADLVNQLERIGWEVKTEQTFAYRLEHEYPGCGSTCSLTIYTTGDASLSSYGPDWNPEESHPVEMEPVGIEPFIYDALDLIRQYQKEKP